MSEPLRYALVGATGIGGYHLQAIRELEKNGLVRLVAVADPALGRLPDLRNELTAQGAGCHLDYRELLRHFGPVLQREFARVAIVKLPSTSPAHAGMRLAQKLSAWKAAVQLPGF